MDTGISRIIFYLFTFHCVMFFSNVSAMINNSEAEVNRRLEEENKWTRFKYSLLMRSYRDNFPMPNFNPIHSHELHYLQFYYDSSALHAKSSEQVFIDFFIKYNAVLAFLHFWVARFVIKSSIKLVPENKINISPVVFQNKCDEMAFYAYWLINLEIDRHLFELDGVGKDIPKSEKFKKVITAFETILSSLSGFVEIERFSMNLQPFLAYQLKSNPFNPRIPLIKVEPQKEKWMKILRRVKETKLNKKTLINPENFFNNFYDDYDNTYDTDDLNHPDKYMEDLYNSSWSAIKVVIGRELFILESFFYSVATGISIPGLKSFRKPTFQFALKLWQKMEDFYTEWDPVTAQIYKKEKPKYFTESDLNDGSDGNDENGENDGKDKFYKIYFVKMLREIDYLRFHYSLPPDYKYPKGFTLKPCNILCPGGFEMIVQK